MQAESSANRIVLLTNTGSAHTTQQRSFAPRLLFSCLAAVATAYLCGFAKGFHLAGTPIQYLVHDDSMISLRVARNFAMHMGPYYNAGEKTAANTSLFWPILLSPVFRASADLGKCVLELSILSNVLMAITVGIITYVAESWMAAGFIAVSMLLFPGTQIYGSSVWEHVPQTLLVTLAFLALLGRIPRLDRFPREACLVLLSLAFLIRPDTLPLMLAVAVSLVIARNDLPARLSALAFAVLCIVGYYALHFHYYGAFVPNTYHLKVQFGVHSLGLGVRYIVREIFASGVPAFLLSLLLLLAWKRPLFNRAKQLVLAAFVLQLLYIVVVGGDVFFYGRFFLMLAPTATLLFWETFTSSEERVPTEGRAGMRALACFCLLAAMVSNLRLFLGRSQDAAVVFHQGFEAPATDGADDQAILASYVRAHVTPDDGQIGLFVLGSLGYYLPEYRMADFLGKADPVIANEPVKWGLIGHNKWDIPYTLQARHVSVVPFTPVPEDEARRVLASHADWAFNAAFQTDDYVRQHYTYRTSAQLGSPGTLGLYIRNDLLGRFPDLPQ